MSIERIFTQLHDPRSWPAAPERPLVTATLADMLAAAVDPSELVPVSPEALLEALRPPAPREISED